MSAIPVPSPGARGGAWWILALAIVVGVVVLGGGTAAVIYVFSDKEERLLSNLQPDFAERVRGFLAAAEAQGSPLMLYMTLRSVAEEQTHIDDGTSHLSDPSKSLHCPQDPDGLCRAADTWPRDMDFSDPAASDYLRNLEPLAAQFGLRNLDSPKFRDLGHWQDA
jgi:hypothetical protein